MARKSLAEQSVILGKRLEAIPEEILAQLRPALVKSAQDVQDAMEALAPEDSGDLVNTIAVTGPGETTPAYAAGGGKRTAGPNQALVTVGSPSVRYAHIQEFGSVHHEAQPFMLPGFRIAKPRIERRIQRAINAAIKKAGSAS